MDLKPGDIVLTYNGIAKVLAVSLRINGTRIRLKHYTGPYSFNDYPPYTTWFIDTVREKMTLTALEKILFNIDND